MSKTDNQKTLLSRKEAARYLGFTHGTLQKWAAKKRPDLKPIKIGRAVRYRRIYLDEYLDNQLKP